MNKNTIVSIFVIIVIVILGIVFWQYSKKDNMPQTENSVQQLDRETEADSTASIDSSLNSIDTDSSSDFNEVDGEVSTY